MNHIGILHHPKIPDSQPLAADLVTWLTAQNVQAWAGSTWDEAAIHEQMPQLSLLLVLGGDGSMLRAARLAAAYDVPVMGINLGRIGFLCEVDPNNWQPTLKRVLAGDCWLEKRLMLQAALVRNGRVIDTFAALNEIVVGRGKQARVVYFQLWVDDFLVTQYTADSLIVATPTGSTAYALAAGGPVLPPQLQNFVVVPVAPHLSMNQPVVLPQHAHIIIRLEMDHEAMLTTDGQAAMALASGDEVHVSRHDHISKFLRVEGEGYFYKRLMQRLGYPIHFSDRAAQAELD